jgi:hypothetical protein
MGEVTKFQVEILRSVCRDALESGDKPGLEHDLNRTGFLATVGPKTVIALLDRIAELEAKVERVEKLSDKWRWPLVGDASLLGSARLSGASDARDKCTAELKEALK